jgi:uncharacterized protein (TIGR03437 family)
MAGVAVYVDGSPAPLLYVSPGQINFLVPMTEIPGSAQVTVVRQGEYGPTVAINLAVAAPQLFSGEPGYLIAEDWNANNGVITTASPAHGGDVVIVYATGMGAVLPATLSGEIAQYASPIANLATLKVTVNGVALAPSAILYAGLTPSSAGLYQINLLLPANSAPDPEIRVTIGDQTSVAGTKLAVR